MSSGEGSRFDDAEKIRRGLRVEVRGRGFPDRVSLEAATEWIDAHSAALLAEEIDVREAAGRVLASDVEAKWAIPAADRAGTDGYAVRSADTVGAGDYNPLELALVNAEDELPAASAASISSGEALPRGADAILPFDLARTKGAGAGNASLPAAGAGAAGAQAAGAQAAGAGAVLEVFGAVAEGFGVERKGQQVQAGTKLMEAGRVLLPQDIGLLASLGVERVQGVRRPQVGILVGKPKRCGESGGQGDANAPMLRALVERDGGSVVKVLALESDRRGFAIAYAADLMLVAGRSGTGWDDDAAQSIAEVGELAMHGVALRPGGSAGMGSVGSAPVVLLPGDPLDCLCAYEMLAGRMVRRMGGRAEGLPYAVVEAEVGRKIVSMIGVVDVCRVRWENGKIEALGSAESGGLASAVRADGFVVIPAPLEGYAPGTRVSVYVYGGGSRNGH
jgi:molybdopterin molybdotransferase